ncbi:restriction endonuclease subunit S [uncultured Eubacterium sp.]|uniref:restriction endonuclease subunit S n=1 Tax=uncultured Eubacterium sp. TaxID=165185 RepID=UPI0026DB5577|nr:restriction endonuclease subunit S [uncultured Eubacterium sp.]
MKNDKKPQVRFKGFNDDWEQRKLGEMGSTFTGLSGKTKEDFGHGDAKFITYMNVFSNPIANLDMTEYVEIDSKQNCVKAGDVFFTTSSETPEEVGMSCVMSENADNIYLNSFCFGYRPTVEFDLNYLAYVLRAESFRKNMTFLAQGISRYNISKNKVMEIKISVPSLDEQNLVGAYFSDLDHLITLHQRKCDKLQKIKKSMLEKMFPQSGMKKPEIRFKGFNDDWEQRKLSDVADVRDGTHASPKYISEGHPLVTSKNVKDGFVNYDDIQYISDEDFDEINKRSKVDVNDVLIGMIGTIGNIALIRKEPDFAIKNVALIKDAKKINYLYIYHFLQSNSTIKQLTNSMDGGTQKFIALGNIRNLDIDIPSDQEQAKLGQYFESLDNLITLHQRKLEKLKYIKKSMLENMFV